MSLYIVATPIGNLEDITWRALDILKSVAKIYCEDTRRTKILLDRFAIKKPLESFHQHSLGKVAKVVAELKDGREIAYLSDAGTPGIQDPGGQLVAAARQVGVRIVPIPGPSAVTTLLSVAGIAADRFYFAGFVPTKKGRKIFIKKILATDVPVVIFETAPRLTKLFDQLIASGGAERSIIVGRELTKKFEEISVGSVVELQTMFTTEPPRGELTVVICPASVYTAA